MSGRSKSRGNDFRFKESGVLKNRVLGASHDLPAGCVTSQNKARSLSSKFIDTEESRFFEYPENSEYKVTFPDYAK